ncbi:MAG: hypothetical protein AAF404_18215, partial [Pseudomonadota bacterium]
MDNLKNELPEKMALFDNLTTTPQVVIEGTFDEVSPVDYLSVPDSNIGRFKGASVKLELYADDAMTTDLLDMDFQSIGSLRPLGIWQAGIDAYGVEDYEPLNKAISFWLEEVYMVKRWRLRIQHNFVAGNENQVSA